MSATIDRASPVPYYEQLFAILRDRIGSGEIPDGGKLPSELELSRDFGLSRATVRQTMSKLETDGLARRVARRGMFAGPPAPSTGWTVEEGFLESQIRHGQTGISTEVLGAEFGVPDGHASEALRLGPKEKAFALTRVRSLDGRPAMYSVNWFPPSVGAVVADSQDVLNGTGSVNDQLRKHNFLASGAHRVITALSCPTHIAQALDVKSGVPILRVRSLSWDSSDFRFDYYETWVLTDFIPLEVNVSAG